MRNDGKYLLYPADGDIDEDDGLTLQGMLEMLADQLEFDLVKRTPNES